MSFEPAKIIEALVEMDMSNGMFVEGSVGCNVLAEGEARILVRVFAKHSGLCPERRFDLRVVDLDLSINIEVPKELLLKGIRPYEALAAHFVDEVKRILNERSER